jgi:hypothetical protein
MFYSLDGGMGGFGYSSSADYKLVTATVAPMFCVNLTQTFELYASIGALEIGYMWVDQYSDLYADIGVSTQDISLGFVVKF